jgi:predicted transcriptional regulator of viral defense system
VQKNITSLGPKEAEFLSKMASRTLKRFTTMDAVHYWRSYGLAKKKVMQLERRGWIARIERGKYIVIPLEAGPKREWSEDTYLIASALVKPAVIAYWSAIRHWNWTEQIPRVIYVQTTSRKKNTRHDVFGVRYEIVTVPPTKFFGQMKEWRDGEPVLITDKEKTLVDCADDVERAGGIQELVKAVKEGGQAISWKQMDEYVNKFPNGAVKKRLGYLFEELVPNLSDEAREILGSWRETLSAGWAALYPTAKKNGNISTRWRILVNRPIR